MSIQKESPKSSKTGKSTPTAVKYYLVAYNVLSAIGWSYVLLLTLVHLSNLDGRTSTSASQKLQTASSTLARLFSSLPYLKSSGYIPAPTIASRIPPYLRPLYSRAETAYARVGAQTAFVQSFAALEILHVVLKWVRSPLQTTAMQVSSRLYVVWGITEQFDVTHTNPIYASMVFAWAATEVIRYSFYACNLLGYEPYFLLYLRYTTFYVLYLVGAPSEAFVMYSTLPNSSPIPGFASYKGMWKPSEYFRGAMFVIWWPSLYVMYTYMIHQRRKVLGGGLLKAKSKSKTH